MNLPIRIGLIGDYDANVPAHQAIPHALALASSFLEYFVEFQWMPTAEIIDETRIAEFDGLWCVPGSPYRSMEGALCAIRWARETQHPFLGTCGGFQHAVVEYARTVLGWADAEHAETAPEAARSVISPLACSLVEVKDTVRFYSGSRIATAYDSLEATEGYRCRYGLNPDFETALVAGPLRASAADAAGEIRAVELDRHPFFVATLFQPERAALTGHLPPLVLAFARAVVADKVYRINKSSSEVIHR